MDTSDLSDFSSILHAAEQLVGCAEGTINLPRVERSLGQVLEASQELHSKLAQEGTQDVQALVYITHYMLLLTYFLIY